MDATLRTAIYKGEPSTENGDAAAEAIERVASAVFNFEVLLERPESAEYHAWNLGELVRQFKPESAIWPFAIGTEARSGPVPGVATPLNDLIKRGIWPTVKRQGLVEFTGRLAHRATEDTIEVVEVVPLDPARKRKLGLPDGLSYIGLGVFWPLLMNETPIRWNIDTATAQGERVSCDDVARSAALLLRPYACGIRFRGGRDPKSRRNGERLVFGPPECGECVDIADP